MITDFQQQAKEEIVISAQEGPQTEFLSSPADIVIFGGAAGGGKTFGLLLESLRYVDNPHFGGVFFRRTSPQITNEGGLWDEASKMYPLLEAKPNKNDLLWRFPSGAKIAFKHLQHEDTVRDWQGSQVPFIVFDELTHFCMKDNTEVLTENGWVNIVEVKEGCRVYSLTELGETEYQPVKANLDFDYEGELVCINQRNGIAFNVTPNHRTIVRKQDSVGGWKFVRADKLEATIQSVVRTGSWSGKEAKTIEISSVSGRGIGGNQNSSSCISADDYLELLGWYISEGCAIDTKSPFVCIRQMKHKPGLISLLERLPYRVQASKDGQYRIFSRQLFSHFKPLGNLYEKRVPSWVFDLSQRQIKIFFDAFVEGDGHKTESGAINIGLANQGLRDDLQRIAFLLGRVGTSKDSVNKHGFNVYTLNIGCRQGDTQTKPDSVYREHHKGLVHCLTVEKNHTFYVRVNGRCHWTGNTENQFFYMLSRNRSGVWGGKPYIRGSTNPAANSWVKKFLAPWIDKSYHDPAKSGEIRYFVRVKGDCIWARTKAELMPYLEQVEIPEGMKKEELINDDLIKSASFIKSSIYDNKKLLSVDPGYLANLMSLPEGERERLLYGNWDASDGMYFSEWNETLHVPDGTPEFPFPEEWDYFLYPQKYSEPSQEWSYFAGVDYGKAAPFSFHLMASNSFGEVVVIDEIYERGLLPTEQADRMLECLEKYKIDPKKDIILYCDPSMFPPQDVKKRIGPYPIESYQKAGLVCVRAVNDRIPGWTRFKEFLHEPHGFRVIKGRAPNLVRTIPMQVPDKRDPEDLDTTGEDHAEDSCIIGSSLVLTTKGLKPIKEIAPGDRVVTSRGNRLVLASGKTGVNREVKTVKFSDGSSVTGTTNHPIFVTGKGWTSIENLSVGERVISFGEDSKSFLRKLTVSEKITEGLAAVLLILKTGFNYKNQNIKPSQKAVTVSGVNKEEKKQDVYNLSVQGVHEYFANGILVSNCRYGLMSRMMKPKKRTGQQTHLQAHYKGKPVQTRSIPEALR